MKRIQRRETFNFDQLQCYQSRALYCKADVHGNFVTEVITEVSQELLAGHFFKVIPLKLFYYQTFFETWRN